MILVLAKGHSRDMSQRIVVPRVLSDSVTEMAHNGQADLRNATRIFTSQGRLSRLETGSQVWSQSQISTGFIFLRVQPSIALT